MSKEKNSEKNYLNSERKKYIILKLTEAKISILERQYFSETEKDQFDQKINFLINELEKYSDEGWVQFAILNIQEYVFEIHVTVNVSAQEDIMNTLSTAIFQGYYTKAI